MADLNFSSWQTVGQQMKPVGLVEVHLHAGKAERGDLRHGVVDNLATQMVEMVAINDVGRIGCRLTTPQNGVIEHERLARARAAIQHHVLGRTAEQSRLRGAWACWRMDWQIECDRNKHRLFVVGLDWRQKRWPTIK